MQSALGKMKKKTSSARHLYRPVKTAARCWRKRFTPPALKKGAECFVKMSRFFLLSGVDFSGVQICLKLSMYDESKRACEGHSDNSNEHAL